jgi:V-type H+-transporting ATPase subunit a
MGATLYPIDANAERRNEALKDVNARLEDLQAVLYNTGTTRRDELSRIGENLSSWEDLVRKEKIIYETLNYFNYDARRKTLIAEGWCPKRDIVPIQLALRHATVRSRYDLVWI